MRAPDAVRRQQAGVGANLVQVFGNRQRVPDGGAVVAQARHQDRRRQQQDFGPRRRVIRRGDELLERIRADVTDYEPKTDFQAQAYQPLVDQVAAADQARNARASSTGATMPGVVWFGLLTGAVVTIGMVLALQIRRTPRELVLAGLFSALIAFLLFLIWDFDAPFSRGIAASAEPFLNLFPQVKG